MGLPSLLQSEPSTQRCPKHTKGQLQGLMGSTVAPFSSDFHNLALSVKERVGDRVQEMLWPMLATVTICAIEVVINTWASYSANSGHTLS